MNIFKQYFKDTIFEGKEVSVRCPFEHYDEKGNPYFEEHPSAHINSEKSTFHCKVCGEGYSETKFLAKMNGISYHDARKLIAQIENSTEDDWFMNIEKLWRLTDRIKSLNALGITNETIKELKLGFMASGVSFPVYMYGELLDIRTYNIEKNQGVAKVTSESGAKAGLIIPFDIWLDSKEDTLIMAGEKDMALARSLGYNAINVTGGEQAFPKLFKHTFKGRNCYIVYDNDDAGKTGARKMAAQLKEVGAVAFVVEGHHAIANEKGEDFSDYIMKYGKTKADFDELLNSTSEFSEEEFREEKEKIFPTVKLLEATRGQYRNKLVRSTVQVTATFDQSFGIADYVEFVKTKDADGVMVIGDKKEWSLDENNREAILKLMDSNLKEKDVAKNLYHMAGVPANEKGITMRKLSYDTVFKATITDLVESDVVVNQKEAFKPLEIVAYTIGKKLESGMKYKLTYKLVQHPLQAQEMVAIVTSVEQSDDTVSSFRMTDAVKESLKVFQGEPKAKMYEIYERAKGLIGSFANEQITLATDLVYHSPLGFQFGTHDIKGFLDVMIVGESRTGKSDTATILLKTYELGTFSTLKNASVAGLIGGSNKIGGSFKTMVGTVPRNHLGMVIFEEFSGADPNFIKAMTDIRSAGKVRITRVNGELSLPAKLRMLTLSNQKTSSDNHSKPLSNYPNGVTVLLELIGAAEDIARYDFFVLVPEPQEHEDPLAKVSLPFPTASYKNRVRWVWSRSKEQVLFDEGVDRYIVQKATELNKSYKSHIKFFGTEGWKKLARLSVATAGMLVSTDETWENIVVKKEHVDWAVDFFTTLYDNDVFRLKQYVLEQNRYSEINSEVVARVQALYEKHTTLLTQMESTSQMTSRNLQAISGLEQKAFNPIMQEMAQLMLFQWQGDRVVPSERFRKAMSKVYRETEVKRIGE